VHDGDYQGTAQMNFCDQDVPYTRITEHKFFTPWETFDKTIIFKEYSKETSAGDIPYYPKRLKEDNFLLKKYRRKAESLSNVSFLGRLATYRYMDMHEVIREAIEFSEAFTTAYHTGAHLPLFPNVEY
jgi:UDP-galactopyranose mutase